MINETRIKDFEGMTVQTKIFDATDYYPAEEYHQRYLEENPKGECVHMIRFDWNDY